MQLRASTVLFDLDGTLVDTAPDLGAALNAMRQKRGLSPIPESECRPQSSHGAQGLIQLGFKVDRRHPDFSALRQEFLDHYETNLTCNSPLFPGMAAVLEELDASEIKWGVVTNKPARFTQPLLDHLGLTKRAVFVVSGDTCAQAKPHPAPLLHACQLAQVTVRECIYVGDAERDIQAANAAGMPALVALYGYLGQDDRPMDWGARGYINTPAELLDWVIDKTL
ncbi:MAG: phosphoglycolate phosphatase [Hydrogenophilales bacterium 28-61-23]|nr:MAG: phosphoglycolate phosphatase [Hydrogenophilales bacterium 28-61-23]